MKELCKYYSEHKFLNSKIVQDGLKGATIVWHEYGKPEESGQIADTGFPRITFDPYIRLRSDRRHGR